MTLTELKYLIAVADEKHFGRAAERSFVSQPSLSAAIKNIEQELGVQLLNRTTRKLSLTEAGRGYFEQAERALHSLGAAAEEAAGLDREPRGIVRVTAPVDVSMEQAESILNRARVEKLLLVDGEKRLAGLITMRDIENFRTHPMACRDARGRLRVGAAIGVRQIERAEALIRAEVDVIVVGIGRADAGRADDFPRHEARRAGRRSGKMNGRDLRTYSGTLYPGPAH